MKRRLFAALAASALIIVSAVPAGTAAAGPQKRFERIDPSRIDTQLLAAVLSEREVQVIVELDGAAAIRRDLDKQQRVAVAGRLEVNQRRLDAPIRKLGGRIEARFQYAYNGLKVRVSGRQLTALGKLPGVKAIHRVPTYQRDNRASVPFIGAPAVWRDYSITGNGQTIAVIDTGIDYTHANFGGAGTEAAYDANDDDIVEPGTFPTAKVVGGWDFVGDEYDPSADDGSEIPAPDPDPLDCNGHGSHVAGTAAGFGVKSDHSTYTGPYNNIGGVSFGIGPGVAPRARLVALKVFGCDGGTNVLVEALEWVGQYNMTHADAIDVVNMSLGGISGDYDAGAVASDALVASGVSVVAAAGNQGPNAYMVGSPAAATNVIAVGASDVLPTHPGAIIDRATGPDIAGSNQNAHPGLPINGTLEVLADDPTTPIDPLTGEGNEFHGCEADDYGALPDGSIAVIQRGICTFVQKGAAAEEAGADGVIVINRDDITDPNEVPTFLGYQPSAFDIPMIGVGRGHKAALQASDGIAASLKAGPAIPNADYLHMADFSSGGPRLGDSHVKPDVTAPGVNIVSTAVGLGYKGDTVGGTSMASPHVAGVAALVRAKNPAWRPEQVKAAIVGTAVVAKIAAYNPRISGSGMVWPRRAVDTVAYVLAGDRTPNLSFGYDPRRIGTYTETKRFTIYNTSASSITYRLTSPGIVRLSATTVTVPARSNRTISATASLTATQLAASRFASQTVPGGTGWGSLLSYHGVITATPTVAAAGRYQLRIQYRAVPRAASNVVPSGLTEFESNGTTSSADITLRNDGIHRTFADVYAWGLSDPKDLPAAVTATNDIRAVGLQVLPADVLTGEEDEDDRALIWAINTHGRWSAGYQNVFVIAIFGDDPGPDFLVLGVDEGLVTTGNFNGRVVSVILSGDGTTLVGAWVADAPANGSTILLPALASEIGRTAADSTVDYEVVGENLFYSSEPQDGFVDEVDGRASLSVFAPEISQGDFVPINAGQRVTLELSYDDDGLASNPSKGWMIVALDDLNGAPQADLVPAPARP